VTWARTVARLVERSSVQHGGKPIKFGDIGPVELKGVSGTVHLLRAHLS
jgi:hypothetical protein